MTLTPEELQLYSVLQNPVLWAQAELNWTARDYQIDPLNMMCTKPLVVLRLGRRLGKTEKLAVAILWHSQTQINKGPNNQYDILIITPYETQIDLIFKRLHELIDISTTLKGTIKRDVYHCIEFHNGTCIKGLTAGSKSGTGANNTRGQHADVLILDEVDYMGEDDITNIINIRNEAPERIKIIATSTPSGRRGSYYKWCQDATYSYTPMTTDVQEILNGTPFKYKGTKKRGNGWSHFHAPSTVNKELLKINPETNRTYFEDIEDELTELRFQQEVMAEFGEEAVGVFQNRFIDKAKAKGVELNIRYRDKDDPTITPKRGPRILGVDWDKYGAESTILGVEFDESRGLFVPIVRVSIPRTEFTLTNAVDKIIELNDEFKWDWIVLDRGYGETQVELLKLYGKKNPASGLARKIIPISFSDKIVVRDPITRTKIKKDIKPFMVNNAVVAFEKQQVALNPTDKLFIKQLEDYHVVSLGSEGRPKYTDVNEHIIDAFCLCIHGFTTKYSEMLKVSHTNRIVGVNSLDGTQNRQTSDPTKDRDIEPPPRKIPMIHGSVYGVEMRRGGRGQRGGAPSRKSF